MDATRPHLSFPAEWIAATIFLIATLAVGTLIVGQLRVQPGPVPRDTVGATPSQPSIPADAVAVPKLMLGDGLGLEVGETSDQAEAKLSGASMTAQVVERGPLGSREVRSYEVAGTRFIVVLEPFERNGAPRVAAIYLR